MFAAIGFLGAPLFLVLMNSPADVIELSTLYIRIYFLGLPFSMLYNFGAAVHRSVGNTKKPLLFLSLAGVLNVVLNLIFVIGFSMGVAGVAIATVISQMLSAALVILSLMRSEGCYRIDVRKLRIHRVCLERMFIIGIPSGLQSGIFSLTNVIVQASVNSFEKMAMSGNAASGNIESFIFISIRK